MRETHPIGFQIRIVSNLLKRKLYEVYPTMQDPLTELQGHILGYLYHRQDQEIFQRDIEEQFYIRRSTVSRLLSKMEEQGLLTRQAVVQDARLKKLTLTPKAMALHEKIQKQIDWMEQLLSRGLSQQEQEQFFAIMQKIEKNLS